jgi:hypothetical protein
LSCLSFRELNQFCNGVQDAWVVSDGGKHTVPQKHGTGTGGGIVQRNCFDFSATQINPYSHSRLRAPWLNPQPELNSPFVIPTSAAKKM